MKIIFSYFEPLYPAHAAKFRAFRSALHRALNTFHKKIISLYRNKSKFCLTTKIVNDILHMLGERATYKECARERLLDHTATCKARC